MSSRSLLTVLTLSGSLLLAASSPGRIVGRVTDQDTGQPVAGVYITIGYKSVQRAAITDEQGRYVVPDVPVELPADVFGFYGGGYRYHNSIYDDHLHIVLRSGETYRYDFRVRQLNDPAGEPHVSRPSITPDTARPGQTVTLSLIARDGRGGLSDEVMAASPKLQRLVLLTPVGGDLFRGSLTIPAGTPSGDYPFAFFAASNECYDNGVFPRLTLHVAR